MAEIPILLSGEPGLANGFAGDADEITPSPQRLLNAEDGQMAQGVFNPYLRRGYMAPSVNSTTALTHSSTPSTELASSVVDVVSKDSYFADRGRNIYKADTLVDLSLSLHRQLPAGSIITDLEIYEINAKRSLFYVYNGDTFKAQETVVSENGVYDWAAATVRIDPASGQEIIVHSTESYRGESTQSYSLTIPSGFGNLTVVVALVGDSGVTPEIDSVAMTSVLDQDFTIGFTQDNISVFYINNIAPGTRTLDIVQPGSSQNSVFVMVLQNTATVPISVTSYVRGTVPTVENKTAVNDSSVYLSIYSARDTRFNLGSISSLESYDSSAQTGNAASASWFKPDGTIMYLMGETSSSLSVPSIYQYTLSTAWQLSSGVSYASKALDVSAQISDSIASMFELANDGNNVFVKEEGSADLERYALGTAWDISTGSHSETLTMNVPNVSVYNGFAFNSDGTRLYVQATKNSASTRYWVLQYNLSTAWDLSTATYEAEIVVPIAKDAYSLQVIDNDQRLYVGESDGVDYLFSFAPDSPGQIDKLNTTNFVTRTTGVSDNTHGTHISVDGQYWYYRDFNTSPITRYTLGSTNRNTFGSRQPATSVEFNNSDYEKFSIRRGVRPVEIGVESLVGDTYQEEQWLSDKQGISIDSPSDYNFIRLADNGFGYIFVGNAVHKIDGSTTGGEDGTITRNVLLFPEYFRLTDALDYRSQFYIAVNQNPVTTITTDRENYTGSCGIFVWNRISVELEGTQYIELPGVREIKKIYKSPDGVLKLITISDTGITELRRFGYNDSGGVVFPVFKELGLGAAPQLPDGSTVAGDKVVWLGSDGKLYAEKLQAVNILSVIKEPGVTTETLAENITPGVVVYGSGTETASNGFRSNKQGFVISYDDSGVTTEKLYPFDLTDGSNNAQTPHRGDVYTAVTYIPITSTVRRLRIYNAPVANSSDDVIATIKVYFNQSTTPTMPSGMTKSITKKDAKRGYVDFNISKQYVHAVQIEIEWATTTNIGEDMYLPSVAIISTEEAGVKTPTDD